MLVLEMSCGEPPSVDNALPVGGNLYGDTVIYWCKNGFIQGPTNGSVICQKDGKWSWNGANITCKLNLNNNNPIFYFRSEFLDDVSLLLVNNYACTNGYNQ